MSDKVSWNIHDLLTVACGLLLQKHLSKLPELNTFQWRWFGGWYDRFRPYYPRVLLGIGHVSFSMEDHLTVIN